MTETTATHEISTLDSGVRVVTERIPTVRSVALGFWIGTGSVLERDTEAGLSHLLEHMLFRGTERYASEEIDQIFDSMGAELNAGTGKEMTSVHARVLDRHLEKAFDVIGDMVWRPKIEEIDAEREVVLEEIAMYEDDPQDRVFDLMGEAVFGPHPLGRAILGRADVVGAAEHDQLAAFHAARYTPANIVIAAAGSVDHEQVVAWARDASPKLSGADAPRPPAPPAVTEPTARFRVKDTEQYHVCLGGPGLARDDDRRFALRVLDMLLGATSSSRLFQAVREKRGLAYSVFSFHTLYAGAGQVGIYVGTRAENLEETLRVIGGELEQISGGRVEDVELQRARDNLQGRVVLALESTTSRMDRLGASLLADLPILDVDEVIERIDAVTADDVSALAHELFAPTALSAAGIGPDGALFAQALETVNVKLAGIAHLHASLVG
ncbi:MAG TPA: pitrilysin family protein [Solirubrobacteraceae bacterium]